MRQTLFRSVLRDTAKGLGQALGVVPIAKPRPVKVTWEWDKESSRFCLVIRLPFWMVPPKPQG